jgi:V8-like Glu-specific endopeptidase
MSVTQRAIQPDGQDLGPTGSAGAPDEAMVADAIADALPTEEANALPPDDGGDSMVVTPPPEEDVIHGTDDRVDYYDIKDFRSRRDADCVASMFLASQISFNQNGDWVLNLPTVGDRFNLCDNEKFENQPSGAFGTAFLVAKDIVATAGHAVDDPEVGDVHNIRFVFGFKLTTPTSKPTIIPHNQLYTGVKVLAYVHNSAAADWALVRLDRAVPDHRIAGVRRTGTVPVGTPLHVIGHPKGLPLKFADNAIVTDNQTNINGQPWPTFLTNLDTFRSNSGSPVFNSITHEVEGILARGIEGEDLTEIKTSTGTCNRWTVKPQTPGSSACTRATELRAFLGPGWQELDDSLATVAMAASGKKLYRLTSGGQVYRYTGTPYSGWNLLSSSGAVEIVADGSLLYRRQQITGAILRYVEGPLTTWEQIGGNPLTKQLAAGGGKLYQRMDNGELWCYTSGPASTWVQLDNNWQTLAIVADGNTLYQLHRNGQIYKYLNIPMSGWLMLDNNTKTNAIVAASGKLYQLHDTGQIWQYMNTPLTGWALLSNQTGTQQIATDGTHLYRRDANGSVYRYTGTPLSGWQLLDDSKDTTAIAAAGGEMYQLRNTSTTGSLRRLVE